VGKKWLEKIKEVVAKLCEEANYGVRKDVFEALKKATENEEKKLSISWRM